MCSVVGMDLYLYLIICKISNNQLQNKNRLQIFYYVQTSRAFFIAPCSPVWCRRKNVIIAVKMQNVWDTSGFRPLTPNPFPSFVAYQRESSNFYLGINRHSTAPSSSTDTNHGYISSCENKKAVTPFLSKFNCHLMFVYWIIFNPNPLSYIFLLLL